MFYNKVIWMNIQKTKKNTHSKVSLFLRKYSVIRAHYFIKRWIEPHQIVLGRTVIFWWLSLYFFYQDLYIYHVAWLLTVFLNSFFDMIDGDMARNYNKKTDLWKFLDEWLDGVFLNSLILLFLLKFFLAWFQAIYIVWWIIALFGIIWSTKMTLYIELYFWINCISWHQQVEIDKKNNTWDFISIFLYELITPKYFFLSLFSNFRYYLLIWMLCQQMPLALLIYWIAINIRWISLFIALSYFYKWTNLALFHSIKKVYTPLIHT
jgi:phosphatidylglycerophosphate synthase